MSMIARPHISLDEQGVAWIDDARVKVIEVVVADPTDLTGRVEYLPLR